MIEFNKIEYACHTDVGVRRSHNQDSHAVLLATDIEHWREIGHVFLVADGMGGHAVGELASKIAVDNIPHLFSKYVGQDGTIPAILRSFTEANATIYNRGKQNREFLGMGTTGTALILRPDGAWVGHVGDSRVYRVRGGVIEQLSFDHSFLWEIARQKGKAPEEIIGIPANRILRSLGPEGKVDVDIEGPHPLGPGDVFLICSDGLTGQVNDRVIGSVLTALAPKEAVQFLVHFANLQGGPDNTTVIVVRTGGEPSLTGGDNELDVVFRSNESTQPITPRFSMLMHRLSRLPWAFILLTAGILWAGVAIYLTTVHMGLAMSSFFLAGLSLLSGIGTLMIQHIREMRKLSEKPAERVLQIYRQLPCPLDQGTLERLEATTKSLEANIKEKGWELDTKKHLEHAKLAAAFAKQGKMRDAFREQCRAMLVLMETVHRHRGKNEDFKPVWDEPAAG